MRRRPVDIITADGKAICSNCSEAWPLSHYQNSRAGGWCRKCRSELEAKRRLAKGILPRKKSKVEDGKKLCLNCDSFKDLSEFPPSTRGLAKVGSYCIPCHKSKYYDRDRAKQYTYEYRDRNRERWNSLHRLSQFNRRSTLKAVSDGTVTDEFLKQLYSSETCYYCGGLTERKDRTADHKTSLNKGGLHSASNLVMACFSCNSSKRDLSEEEFKEKLRCQQK